LVILQGKNNVFFGVTANGVKSLSLTQTIFYLLHQAQYILVGGQ